MNIGIIIWSSTGNTLYVAEKLRAELIKNKHTATIERILVKGGSTSQDNERIISVSPNHTPFDALILGSPVEAFNLSPVMKSWLENVESFDSKHIYCFTTHFFPWAWMGGIQAIKQMKQCIIEKKGINSGYSIIDWSNSRRESEIDKVVLAINSVFSQ